MEKVIIYGTGKHCENIYLKELDETVFQIVSFADSNKEKQGGSFHGIRIIPPEQIGDLDYDRIIIASTFYDEIKFSLVNEYHIMEAYIAGYDYILMKKIEYRYQAYYTKHHKRIRTDGNTILKPTDKLVIYTAITGNYDELRDPLFLDSRCRYICYTDQENLRSDIWEIRKLNILNGDYNRSAKIIKILPHLFLQEYDYSIWVDGKFQITGDLVALINRYHRNSNFMSFMHYGRRTVAEEAAVCINLKLDNPEIISNQMDKYRREGFQDDNELIEGGILFRRHKETDVKELMELWWSEILTGSRRDQLSFNYSAWKRDFFFDLLDLYLYHNTVVKYYPHNK